MAVFGYFQLDNYGDPKEKDRIEADYMDNPMSGEIVQLFNKAKSSLDDPILVAVFKLRGGEYVKQL